MLFFKKASQKYYMVRHLPMEKVESIIFTHLARYGTLKPARGR